jgi:hypothetical protein
MPDEYHCTVPELVNQGYGDDVIKHIAVPTEKSSCLVYDWDYSIFSNMSQAEAQKYANETVKPRNMTCLQNDKFDMVYKSKGADFPHDLSIVPEWQLLCERTVYRSKVQAALSVGKFVGATLFGVLSDK